MKVLFTYHYGKEKMNAIKNLGYEVIYIPEKEIVNCEEIEDIEVLVCYNPFRSLDITKLNKLKWIQLSSIGSDQAPQSYIKEKGIFLTNNKGGYSIPMGEWIVLKILEIYKNSKYFYEKQRDKEWKLTTDVFEIYGKNVGFLGTGSIAKEGAKRLQGFGVNTYGLNTSGSRVEYFDNCFAIEEIDRLLAISDIVVCTIPYTNMTHNLLNQEKMSKMKDGSVLINVSRGNIIVEDDLLTKLREGKYLGVALDVFDYEPLPKESPLWDFDNVYITPHNSWISEMRNERRFKNIYQNMKRYIMGENLNNLIDIDRGY